MNKPTMIIGASPKPDRYAYKAQRLLKEHGHTTIPVNSIEQEILGDSVFKNPSDYVNELDTVTLYVRPSHLEPIVDDLIALIPKRIIFNPGTEDLGLHQKISNAGIEATEACTIVFLHSGQY
jgi:predicted CoA-binding protein